MKKKTPPTLTLLSQFDELEQYRSRQENHIQAEVQTGLISEIEGRQQLVDLHQQVADKISATLPELREMAKLPGTAGENIRKMLEDLDTELLRLHATTGSLTQAFKNGLQDGIESSLKGLATGTMSLSSAVLNLGQSIVNAMAQIAAQKLAQMAISGLSSGAGAIGLGALFAATGGYIQGPGTATSDSIPARLSDGEYVVRAAAVSHYGVDFLHALNATRLRKFAEGGLVSPLHLPSLPPVTASSLSDAPALSSQAPAPVIQQTLVMNAGEAFQRGINTVEGERAFMTFIRVNKQTIGQELGVSPHGT